VAHVLGVSISTASHQLRKLRDLKLLEYRNDGKMAYYSLRNQLAARLVADTLEEVGCLMGASPLYVLQERLSQCFKCLRQRFSTPKDHHNLDVSGTQSFCQR